MKERAYWLVAVVGPALFAALLFAGLPALRTVSNDGVDAHRWTAILTTGSSQAVDALSRDVFERVNRERLSRGLLPRWGHELTYKAGR